MRYAACNELVHDRPFADACRLIARHGYEGIELAPYTLAADPLRMSAAERRRICATMRDAGLVCVGLHWLLKAPPGLHLTTPDVLVRRRSWEAMRHVVDLCHDVGGSLAVLGSGKQRGTQGITREATMALLVEELAGLAPHLEQAGVTLLLEPLPVQVTDVLNTLEEVRTLVRALDCPRIASMLDFHDSQAEEQPWDRLIAAYSTIIRHVHLNEVDGRHPTISPRPGRARSAYTAAFTALRHSGYDGWISLETFHAEESPEAVLAEARAFLDGMAALWEGAPGAPGVTVPGGR